MEENLTQSSSIPPAQPEKVRGINSKFIIIIMVLAGVIFFGYTIVKNSAQNDAQNIEGNITNTMDTQNSNNQQQVQSVDSSTISTKVGEPVTQATIDHAIKNFMKIRTLLESGDLEGLEAYAKEVGLDNLKKENELITKEDASKMFIVFKQVNELNLRQPEVQWDIQFDSVSNTPTLYVMNFPTGDDMTVKTTNQSDNWMAFELKNGQWYWNTMNFSL
ncbi:MAG: hypothetical protein KBC42_03020 [Candidatus Pacebacteria bacterium]|nr:hypothetical protein [Candidatus Paceibacterota bacterium]MBP9780871.1 hypothetical protein [Candidatus Paceibacterota bacterium]